MTKTPSDGPAAEVSRMLEERAVLSTLYRYGHSIDYGLEEDWVDCFTSDGVFDVRLRLDEGRSHRHSGRDALAAFVAQHTRAPDRYHKHLLVEPVIDVSGDHASVRSYFTRLDAADDGTPYIRAFGRYVDRMVKGPDGVWRFEERVAEVEGYSTGP